MRTIISVLVAVCMTIGMVSPSYSQQLQAVKEEAIEGVLREELVGDGLNLNDLRISHDRIAVQVNNIDSSSEQYIVELFFGTNRGNISELNMGKAGGGSSNIPFTIDESSQVSFEGGDRSADSHQGKALALPVFIILSAKVMEALILAGLIILVAGLVYILVTEFIPRLEAALQQNRKLPRHFMAVRHDRGIFAGPGLTFGEAVIHGKSGGDTWSYDGRKAARAIARTVHAGKKPIGPEKDKHGKNKYCHFHPYKKSPPMHAFYGVPTTVCRKND